MLCTCCALALIAIELNLASINCAFSLDDAGRIAGLAGLNMLRNHVDAFNNNLLFLGANFKLREGMKIGAKVTLRGEIMYEFVDRLFNFSLPRVRDFKGINPDAFDGRGNYALGLKEQLIFPEIEYDKIDRIRGMDIAFVTTATTDAEARDLLTMMGAPFAKEGEE